MREYAIVSTLALIVFSVMMPVYADGPLVPNNISTQSKYCVDGTCSTGPANTIPVNYSKSIVHLPVLLVSLSGVCETMNKQGIKGCPDISELVPYDTSNQYISGKFVKQGNFTIREKPEVKNNWLYYTYSIKPVICVECTFDISSTNEARQIIINPHGFTFINKTAIVKNTWVSWSDRSMQGCDVATIGYSKQLLDDTIKYMLSGCTVTSFNGTQVHVIQDKPWSYDNPYSSLHMVDSYKNILHGHFIFGNYTSGGLGPSDCIHHVCSITTSSKKW